MPTILFYFDFASPYAYVAFHQLPQILGGMAWQVQYRPVAQQRFMPTQGDLAVAGQACSQQAWMQRHAPWLAAQHKLPFQWPSAYPFKSATWLRMALAASPHGQPGRHVCETLFNAIWQHGHNPNDSGVQRQAWHDATALLPAVRHVPDQQLQQELFRLEQAALAHGVCDVPGFVLLPQNETGGMPEIFCGVEGLPMLREAVHLRQLSRQLPA